MAQGISQDRFNLKNFIICMLFLNVIVCEGVYAETNKLETSIVFEVKTNVIAVSYQGVVEPGKMKLEANLQESDAQLTISNVLLTIPVDALSSGISLRDRHMREKVFTTPEGSTPPIVFQSAQNTCALLSGSSDCQLVGELQMSGQQQSLSVPLHLVKQEGHWKASGEIAVSLEAFKIKVPAYLGVKVENLVIIKFEVRQS
ncbi:YceI family protein [Deltaproteobacteria bacterium TL4]